MKKQDLFFTSFSGAKVRFALYECECEPKAILQISHGMSEYIDRYDEFASYLCERGFIVCGEDHLGHGQSAERGLGYISDKDGDKCLVEDTKILFDKVKEMYPTLPHAVMGHSMGSFIMRAFLARYGDEPDCAVIMGTSGAKMPFTVAIALANILGFFKGKKAESKLLYGLSLGSYNKEYDGEGSNGYEWLSKDRERTDAYAADPLCGFGFTCKGYADLFRLLRSIGAKEWYEKVPKDLPMLLVSGGQDPVGEKGNGVRLVYDGLVNAGCKNVELKLFDDCRHELLNETNRAETTEFVYEYLKRELKL